VVSVQPGLVDRVIWVVVLGFVGALNGVLVFGVTAWLTRRTVRGEV